MQPDEMKQAFTIRQMIKQVEDTSLRKEQRVVEEVIAITQLLFLGTH